ncbi:hypothetical protein PFLmoz3_02108 [Pseudomonas fluorescens]|uniref:Uncharacterized protein n=1 Tax=Pseudomonas fluorescens TaxID=294 RepID=A0A109LKS8_PSEFL|nr:hypothetical protein PFLmoz3_02108 [Pseudomonas fluorescens]
MRASSTRRSLAANSLRWSEICWLAITANSSPFFTDWPRLTFTASTTPAARGTIWEVRSSSKRTSPGSVSTVLMARGCAWANWMPAA